MNLGCLVWGFDFPKLSLKTLRTLEPFFKKSHLEVVFIVRTFKKKKHQTKPQRTPDFFNRSRFLSDLFTSLGSGEVLAVMAFSAVLGMAVLLCLSGRRVCAEE